MEKKLFMFAKKKTGTAYATSTNTDLYEYDIDSKTTKNLTEKNLGYDVAPQFSPKRRFILVANETRWL